jgi:hypothetical protein
VVDSVATGAQPNGSIVGDDAPETELLTVNVCAGEPGPANASAAGVIETDPEFGPGPGLTPPPLLLLPPPQAASDRAKATAAKDDSERQSIETGSS